MLSWILIAVNPLHKPSSNICAEDTDTGPQPQFSVSLTQMLREKAYIYELCEVYEITGNLFFR